MLLFKYKTLTIPYQLYELLGKYIVTFFFLFFFVVCLFLYLYFIEIAKLESDICNKLVIQITRGLARIVKIESFRFSTVKLISPILTLLEKTSVNPPSSRQCFGILCEMLIYEYTDLNVYGKMIELINYYYRLQGLSVEYPFFFIFLFFYTIYLCYFVYFMISLIFFCCNLIAQSISSIITIVNNLLHKIESSPQQENDLLINLVNSFLNSLCVCGMDNRLIIKELSIKAFTVYIFLLFLLLLLVLFLFFYIEDIM